MENAIKIFENEEFGNIRVATSENNEPLFCLADVCAVIDITNARNVKSRLDPDDVRLVDTIDSMGRNQKVTFVTESGLYDVVIRSDSEKAKPFRKWITAEVLPSIRKTGGYTVNGRSVLSLSDRLLWVKGVSDILHLNDASTLDLLEKTAAPLGLPVPDYVPASDTVHSATEQLARRNAPIKVAEFNRLMTEAGLMKRESRFSKSKGKEVTWPVLVGDGLRYGCNQVSPKNPRETQPEYYDGKFDELLKRLKKEA